MTVVSGWRRRVTKGAPLAGPRLHGRPEEVVGLSLGTHLLAMEILGQSHGKFELVQVTSSEKAIVHEGVGGSWPVRPTPV